jgi:integrase
MGGPGARARRRGRGEGSIYKDEAKGRWYAAVSVGYGPDGKTWRRHKISGRTRAEVAAKLRELQAEQDLGAQPTPGYTVQRAVDDWLAEGLDGRSARTVTLNRDVLKPVIAIIGDIELRKLTGHDVRRALTQLAKNHSSRTVVIAHNALTRAFRHAEANRHILHNPAALVDTPKGQRGRPSRALTAEQAAVLVKATGQARLGAYVVLSLLTGIRTEEARALRWDHVDLDAGTVAVWRSVRHGGDTKTAKSRRTLGLPHAAGEALREHRTRQAEEKATAGALWKDHGLVFPPEQGRSWTPGTSGGNSKPSAKPRASGKTGHRGNYGRASSACCRPRACRWKRSHGWQGTRAPGPPKSSTGGRSARCSSRALR